MLTKMNKPGEFTLWKSPVEKSVENVEKLEFSTAIRVTSKGWMGSVFFAYQSAYSTRLHRNIRVMLSDEAGREIEIIDEKVGNFPK